MRVERLETPIADVLLELFARVTREGRGIALMLKGESKERVIAPASDIFIHDGGILIASGNDYWLIPLSDVIRARAFDRRR